MRMAARLENLRAMYEEIDTTELRRACDEAA
jgi:hypothetical protein